MMDLIDVSTHKEMFVSHAYRCLTSTNSLIQRVLLCSRKWALGPEPHILKKIAGLGVPTPQQTATWVTKFKQYIGRSVISCLRIHTWVTHRRVYVGSIWFCASHKVCEYIIEQACHQYLINYFSKLTSPVEIFFPYVIGNSEFRRIVPANHAMIWKLRGTGPEELNEADLPDVLNSGKFFARKFSKQSDDPARMAVLANMPVDQRNFQRRRR